MTLIQLSKLKSNLDNAREAYATAIAELYPKGTRVSYKTHGMKQWRTATVHSTWADFGGYVTLPPDHAKPKPGYSWVKIRRVNADHVRPI